MNCYTIFQGCNDVTVSYPVLPFNLHSHWIAGALRLRLKYKEPALRTDLLTLPKIRPHFGGSQGKRCKFDLWLYILAVQKYMSLQFCLKAPDLTSSTSCRIHNTYEYVPACGNWRFKHEKVRDLQLESEKTFPNECRPAGSSCWMDLRGVSPVNS